MKAPDAGPDPVGVSVEELTISGGRRLLLYSFTGLDDEAGGTAGDGRPGGVVVSSRASDEEVAPPTGEGEPR